MFRSGSVSPDHRKFLILTDPHAMPPFPFAPTPPGEDEGPSNNPGASPSSPGSTLVEIFETSLPFPLDGFQREAMYWIEGGESVVVCAPTGSGKTIIAEFAINKALAEGKRLFYTTPLKALSNQKFSDFKETYGEDRVGLLTGDQSFNRAADIVVMTTEVFRNMLYGITEDDRTLLDVGFVVLDECHFMNDAQRGTVWEESIIYCPRHIQVIALSATVANAKELTDWMAHVHGPTQLVSTDFRPVPLRFFYFHRDRLDPLFEYHPDHDPHRPGEKNKGDRREKSRPRLNKQLKTERKGNFRPRDQRKPDYNQLILQMAQREMIPAIFFVFSRRGCDQAVAQTRHLHLLTAAEKELLRREINDFVEQYPIVAHSEILYDLSNGFGCHHAGLLPAIKLLVEQLFQKGLLKVIFATETLAAGINMPARSTVITTISKRTDEGHRILTASEFLQMSGRAGRRGMDPVGYVVIVDTPFQGAEDAGKLASSDADALNSQFTPTYGMVLNLLQRHTLEESQFLIEKSFGQFTSVRRLSPITSEIQEKQGRLDQILNFKCPFEVSDQDFKIYLNNLKRLYAIQHDIGAYRKQIKKYGPQQEITQEMARVQHRRDGLQKTLEDTPCSTCKEFRRHESSLDKKGKLEKQLHTLQGLYQNERDQYWQSFTNIYELLKSENLLDAEDKPTPLGALTAQIRAENEFFIAKLLDLGLLDDLSPQALAGVVCALVTDTTRDNMYANLYPSPQSEQRFYEIAKAMRRVKRIQDDHGVSVMLQFNPVASGLVEAWADGMPWSRLSGFTNFGEGDLVRMFRRTSDLLRQLARIPEIPLGVAEAARQALKQVYRDPIQEIDTVGVTFEAEVQNLISSVVRQEEALLEELPPDPPGQVVETEPQEQGTPGVWDE